MLDEAANAENLQPKRGQVALFTKSNLTPFPPFIPDGLLFEFGWQLDQVQQPNSSQLARTEP